MELSRKRKRELKKLKRGASDLWDDQKEVLDQASRVVQEARRQLVDVGRKEVAPRIRDVYESSRDAGQNLADSARKRISHDVIPAVTSALGTALAALEVARSPQLRRALSKISRPMAKAVVPPKSSNHVGRYILMGIGLVAVAGIAYATWQTLRADDELWITDESDAADID